MQFSKPSAWIERGRNKGLRQSLITRAGYPLTRAPGDDLAFHDADHINADPPLADNLPFHARPAGGGNPMVIRCTVLANILPDFTIWRVHDLGR